MTAYSGIAPVDRRADSSHLPPSRAQGPTGRLRAETYRLAIRLRSALSDTTSMLWRHLKLKLLAKRLAVIMTRMNRKGVAGARW